MSKLSLIQIVKWLLFATIASLSGVVVAYSFKLTLVNFAAISHTPMLFLILPISAAIFVGAGIYRLRRDSAEEGIPAYLKMVNIRKGRSSLGTSLSKFMAAAIVLSFGGSGGVVGPLVRINAGLVNEFIHLFKKITISDRDLRTLTICGASSVLAVIFNAPVGAGFFAVEILRRSNMAYLDLFPSIITSCFTISIMSYFGLEPIYVFNSPSGPFEAQNIPIIIAIAVAAGFYGLGYTKLYAFTRKLLKRDQLRVGHMVGALLVVTIIAFVIDPNLLGTSLNYFSYLTGGHGAWPFIEHFHGATLALLFMTLALMKTIANCITVGSGLSAGFTGPVILVGLFIGASAAQLTGLTSADSTYYAFLVAGVSGMLSASMNVPLAAAIMGAEIFGISYAMPATLSSIIAFQIARSATLFDFQFAVFDNEKHPNVIPFPERRSEADDTKKAA